MRGCSLTCAKSGLPGAGFKYRPSSEPWKWEIMESDHVSSARKQLCILLSQPRWLVHDYSQSFSFCVQPQSRSSTEETQSKPTHLSWPGFPLFWGPFPPRPLGCELRRPSCTILPSVPFLQGFPSHRPGGDSPPSSHCHIQ